MTNPNAENPAVSRLACAAPDVLPRLTDRQLDALRVLATAPARGFTPSEFAIKFWPGKVFARSNGPWGLGPDASGRHGGRMLTLLHRMGLVRIIDHDGYYTAVLYPAGRAAVEATSPDDRGENPRKG